MRRAYALVEGQSEETFVERLLRPHLWAFDLELIPIVVTTKRTPAVKLTGGISKWSKVAREIDLLLRDSSAVTVTTMVDYYGLPSDTPGVGASSQDPRAAVLAIEAAIAASHQDQRLDPFVMLHEFEALLYADPDVVGSALGSAALTAMMAKAVGDAGEPEFVNDGPTSAPSKRILTTYPRYVKTSDGPSLLASIGLAKLRSSCPHFGAWVDRMESL